MNARSEMLAPDAQSRLSVHSDQGGIFKSLIEGFSYRLLQALVKTYGVKVQSLDNQYVMESADFEIRFRKDLAKKVFDIVNVKDAELLIGEGYVNGEWDIVSGNLEDVLSTFWEIANSSQYINRKRKNDLRDEFELSQRNDPNSAKENIEHHYDAENYENSLFKAMLGDRMCYSAALFSEQGGSLDEAQDQKFEVIIDNLGISPGDKVLDIGCGWGTLGRKLSDKDIHYDGITISSEQYNYCQENKLGGGRENYHLLDYREFFENNDRQYDSVTCIEALDHIGTAQYNEFFRLVKKCLKPGGTFFLQLIARPERGMTSTWISKHIYPGGYITSYEEAEEAFLYAGFNESSLVDLTGFHYAETLRRWRNNLLENWEGLSGTPPFDEEFLRKWMFFLSYSIVAFRDSGFTNYHLKLKA